MRFCLLALVALFVGCASPSYTFTGAWTEAEKAQVMAGVSEWPEGKTTTFYRADATNDFGPKCVIPDGITPQGATSFAWTSSGDGESWTCFFVDAIGTASLERVAAHETGHRLGLYHSVDTDPPSIMRANYSSETLAPTAWDIGNVHD